MHYRPVNRPFRKKGVPNWLFHSAAGVQLTSLPASACTLDTIVLWTDIWQKNDRAYSYVKSEMWLANIAVIHLCVRMAVWNIMVWNGHTCSTGMFRSFSGSTTILSFGQTVSARPMPPRNAASSLSLYVYPSHVFWLKKVINLQFFCITHVWLHTFIRILFETWNILTQFHLNNDCSYKSISRQNITVYLICHYAFPRIVYCFLSLNCYTVTFLCFYNNVFFVFSQSLAWTVTRNRSGPIVTQLLAMTVHQWWAVSWNPALLSTARRMRMPAGQTLLSVSFHKKLIWILLGQNAGFISFPENDYLFAHWHDISL